MIADLEAIAYHISRDYRYGVKIKFHNVNLNICLLVKGEDILSAWHETDTASVILTGE